MRERKKQVWLSKFRIQRLMKLFAATVIMLSVVWIVAMKVQQTKTREEITIDSKLAKIEFLQTENSIYVEELRRAAAKAFRSYTEKCLFEDEYRPASGTCLSSYGFSATLLESVETLYILGMTEDYEKAKQLIRDNFTCSNLEWVNRRELFSRGIGALIGSYLVTRESLFLKKACECADLVLAMNSKNEIAPFINIAKNATRMRKWTRGTSIIEFTSGLPELVALYILTDDIKYSMAYLSMLSNIPVFPVNETIFYPEYDLTTKTETQNITRLDGSVVGFLHNIVIADKIKPMKKIRELMAQTLENTSVWTANTGPVMYPFYEIFNYFEKSDNSDVKEFQAALQQRYFEQPSDLLSPGVREKYDGFAFEASVMRSEINNPNITKTIVAILQSLEMETGYSGVKRTNMDDIVNTNIQHSNLMGEWLSLGAWIGAGKSDYFKTSVFNERGHLLYSPSIINSESAINHV